MRLRLLLVVLISAVVATGSAHADSVRLSWPLRPNPAVVREFHAPKPDWQRGHRGVDLAGTPGQAVYSAAPGNVVFAGDLAGRPVVSVAHPGGLRTSYEPVEARVSAGQRVDTATGIGRLLTGHPGCSAAACLHWGAMWGPAARAEYLDPIGLLATTSIRLKPLTG